MFIQRARSLRSLTALACALLLPTAACNTEAGSGSGDVSDDEDTAAGPAEFVAPEQHASDWAAPAVDLPDAPRPYGPSPEPTADQAFYDLTTLDPAAVAEAEPGTVLRSEEVEMTGPLAGASGWRVLYRSTNAEGEPAVVSGMILEPDGAAPERGWPVVAWAHGTTGVADRCAPSATGNLMYDDYGQVGRDLLDQGFVVAATDYHGLGTPGLHSYHRSEEMARATIDSVRAAHGFKELGSLAAQWLTIGHSEGGLAALATDERLELAPEELDYRGAVVAAPSADMGSFTPAMFSVPGRGYGVLFLAAAATVEPRLDPSVALGPQAAERQALYTHGCWEEAVPGFDDVDPEDMLASPEITGLLTEVLNDYAGYDPSQASGPLMVVHGALDESLPVQLTQNLVEDICAQDVHVLFRIYPGAGHDAVLGASSADTASWLADRLAEEPPESNCGAG
ncbi:MAG: lipase family protein [Microthrixaceae bacterium]